jgi:hypothetical protein
MGPIKFNVDGKDYQVSYLLVRKQCKNPQG